MVTRANQAGRQAGSQKFGKLKNFFLEKRRLTWKRGTGREGDGQNRPNGLMGEGKGRKGDGK